MGSWPLLEDMADARLPRTGDTFDDYLAMLRHRRRKAVGEMTRFAAAGLRVS
jgi:hypothetical protein